MHSNGLRYLRWGRDGEAVQPEKSYGVENCLGCVQSPQRQVHAVLGAFVALDWTSDFQEFFGTSPMVAFQENYLPPCCSNCPTINFRSFWVPRYAFRMLVADSLTRRATRS